MDMGKQNTHRLFITDYCISLVLLLYATIMCKQNIHNIFYYFCVLSHWYPITKLDHLRTNYLSNFTKQPCIISVVIYADKYIVLKTEGGITPILKFYFTSKQELFITVFLKFDAHVKTYFVITLILMQ